MASFGGFLAEHTKNHADGSPHGGPTENPPRRGTHTSSQSFIVAVTRAGCSNGITGTVLQPTIDYTATEIVVTFTVDALPPGGYDCQGNDRVSYVVKLGEPIGRRLLIDGVCVNGDKIAMTSLCADGGVRWNP